MPRPIDRPPPADGFVVRLAQNLAVQDVLIAGYLGRLLLGVVTGSGPDHDRSVRTVLVDLGFFTIGIVLTRGGILRHDSFANALVYRLTLFFTVFLSYFQLRWILPSVSARSFDAALLAFDQRVFGFEPAIAWDRFVTPATTEWFAFFYFSYFILLTVHVLPMMLNGKDRLRLAHFALGTLMVFCTAHLLYMVVPGSGPHRFLADQFEHPLAGGFFWGLMQAAVDAGSAQKDIFPSLHTAGPTFFVIYSFMHRRAMPFRFTWPVTTFAVTQIAIATMFLRWHYLIDVVAGLALAAIAAQLSLHIVVWESAHRAEQGFPPILTPLDWGGLFRARAEP